MNNNLFLFVVLSLLFATIVYADVWWTGSPDLVINETSHFDAGTYVNASSETNEYNHTANALELSFPYADKDINLTAYWRMENQTNEPDETGLNSGLMN